MVALSYNISLTLKDSLKKIDSLRAGFLLAVIPPKEEISYRWEAILSRTYCSLNLAGNSLDKSQIENILTSPPKKPTPEQKEVVRYKTAFDYLIQNWLASPEILTPEAILKLNYLSCHSMLRSSEKPLKDFLTYLQTNPEHPFIQAAVAQAQITALSSFSEGNGLTARLIAYLLLYKYGYDFRGLLVLEEIWQKEPDVFRENIKRAIKNSNLTLWLEYFNQCAINQLEKTITKIRNRHSLISGTSKSEKNIDLTERQKSVLNFLEQPEARITNRKVQQLFKVSQITASRDLAKLTQLNLVFSHGKGRSVYYTRV